MPLQATSGAASYDATGGGAPVKNYIEDVFSTWLYTGTGALGLNIPNGIDLAGKGGMVWAKGRTPVDNHHIWDTARGVSNALFPNLSSASSLTSNTGVTAFNSNGFTLGTSRSNTASETYASWTFREQAKFFDVVTWTGTGANRTIAHNLGAVPGCIIVKSTNATTPWPVYHRSLGNTQDISLNDTGAATTNALLWNNTTPTSTNFTVGTSSAVNASGFTYVAYVFAHDAGGFGLAGTDNVISCGVYTGNGSATGPVVSLGYEPQWLIIKGVDNTIGWQMIDTMRGMPVGSVDAVLRANTDAAEVAVDYVTPTATGFQLVSSATEVNINNGRYIYIAIRRGPMRTPTTGTTVFSPIAATAASGTYQTTDFPIDTQFSTVRSSGGSWVNDRLRGFSATASPATNGPIWITTGTAAESTSTGTRTAAWDNTRFMVGSNVNNTATVWWSFGRAPSFMDVVCYTGTGANVSRSHNLGVTPELWIVRRRNSTGAGIVGSTAIANTEYLTLNSTAAKATLATYWNSTYPTASVFTTGTRTDVNGSGNTFVAYFFATCPGVSKVGSYTGNGSSQTINCGFTAGSRFVLIKRTDSTGDWYVWDSARGIVSGNDPHISLNTTAAEVTTNDTIDTDSTGFVVNQVAATSVNVTSATYIFLAIA